MDNRHDIAADLAPADALEGLDLLVTDKRGRQHRLSVASEWPELAVAPTPVEPDAEATPSALAPPAIEPAAPDIHHIAIRMGHVIARRQVVEPELEAAVEDAVQAASDEVTGDSGVDEPTSSEPATPIATNATNASDSPPVAVDSNKPSDPPVIT